MVTVDAIAAAETLVFSGGGLRGIAYVGVLQAIKEKTGIDVGVNHPCLKACAGTSIGAFFALVLALGFCVDELVTLMEEMNIEDIAAMNPLQLFASYPSLDDGTKLKQRLHELVLEKMGQRDMTFTELLKRTGKELVVAVSDLTTCSARYLSVHTEPHMSIVRAVLTSMSIPPLFGPTVHTDGHLLVDGGIFDNLPLEQFPSSKTVGFRLHWVPPHDVDTREQYAGRLAYAMIFLPLFKQWEHVSEEYKKIALTIEVQDTPVIDLGMSAERRDFVRKCGYDSFMKGVGSL